MEYYNTIAKSYNNLHKEEQNRKLKIIKQNITIKRTQSLLDVGCGTGLSSNFNCKVTGIDPSREMLKFCRKPSILGKAESLPFKSKSFDIVISITSLHHCNLKKAIKEIRRVAKDRVVISFLKKSKKLKEFQSLIKKNFKINKIIEEEKDIIYFLSQL